MNPNETLEAQLERFWAEADGESETELSATLERILSEGAASPERALFERASLHDFLGQENAAIPLYRAALDSGLAPPHRTAAIIQLASSLRNSGDAASAIALLRAVDEGDPLSAAAQAFLALALYDHGASAHALSTALGALTPSLPAYQRSVSSYASALVSGGDDLPQG